MQKVCPKLVNEPGAVTPSTPLPLHGPHRKDRTRLLAFDCHHFCEFEEKLSKYDSNENSRTKSHITTSEHYEDSKHARKENFINHLSVTRNNYRC